MPSRERATAGLRAPGAAAPARARLGIRISGAVQGVGFRPFVYRLARRMRLDGSVVNSAAGVSIEAEGGPEDLRRFVERLRAEAPAAAVIASLEVRRLEPAGRSGFAILASDAGARKTAAVLPDLATCADCRREIADPSDRRRGYPFTNCIACGPRYTIVEAIPYDRPNTTMRRFTMCADCRREYDDPEDRRFHAQPNACPRCGPRLELVDARGRAAAGDPLTAAATLLRAGRILALKGVGGFQLLADARRDGTVRRLRRLKHREEKPFAVMFPSLGDLRAACAVGPLEEDLLLGPAAPIVLLRPARGSGLAPAVSLASPFIGAMLPYSPLHHLLLDALGFPVVATSGNRSDEPIATGNDEAAARLGGIADAFLWHDRPIARPCDDSVARVLAGRPAILRRARGYAPMPVEVPGPLPRVLALGAHQKSAVAIAVGRRVVLGQHLGDLDTPEAREAFRRAIDDLSRLYDFTPEMVACDLHPDYFSSRHAETLGLPVARIQHHQAHLAACAADNGFEGPYLGVAWDGTGYGTDGTIWGGEFLLWHGAGFRRVARLRPFRLPGGETAVRDGRRSAAGLLHQVPGAVWPERLGLPDGERAIVTALLERGVNAPLTSSVGRLFDAVAALTGVARVSRFEGQAAMSLEAAVAGEGGEAYPAPLARGEPLELDWRPLVAAAAADAAAGRPAGWIATRFHNALVEWIVAVARRAEAPHVVLSGGVFQNACLAARARARLEAEGFTPLTHRRVPPNDGGIALGQAVLAARETGR
jgi:hydrogenase maturation protein HypF